MASKPRRDAEVQPDRPNMAPMIDIVFLLLIFFMCATKFQTPEGLIEAYLPKSRGDYATKTEAVTPVRVKLLWYDRSGRPTRTPQGYVVLKVGEHVFNTAGDLEAVSHPELANVWPRLQETLQTLKSNYQGSNEQGLPVIIDARQQVPTKFVVSALNEVVRAGITDVTFAAPERPY